MRVLAIDTSCDDTCIALAQCSGAKFKLIANLISSQIEIHQKWGGVYPTLARREHQKNLTPILVQALRKAKLIKKSKCQNPNVKSIPRLPSPESKANGGQAKSKCQKIKKILEREETLYKQLWKFLQEYQKPKLDLIAVTIGPGLDPCLWTGVNFARALAYYWKLSIVPVNHIEAHIFANWLKPISSKSKIKKDPTGRSLKLQQKSKIEIKNKGIEFPAICLIVSGGHTQLILIKKLGNYKILGETRDDAAGEAFDKIARILGLAYPGGPSVAKMATKIKNQKGPYGEEFGAPAKIKIKLPRPMIHSKDYDFSFSGLKTAVFYDYKKRSEKERESKEYIGVMAKETQQAIIDVLIKKTIKAAKDYQAKSILLAGGVAANQELRKQFQSAINNQQLAVNFLAPAKNLCTDNAAMIAAAACLRPQQVFKTNNWQRIKSQPNLRINETIGSQ